MSGYHYGVAPNREKDTHLWKTRYQQHPDGTELFTKIYCIGRDSGILGLGYGLFYGYCYLETQNWKLLAIRVASRALPVVAAAIPIPIVVHHMVKAREKRDNWNYAVAGAVSGFCWSNAWGHNRYITLGRMIVFGCAASLYHQAQVKEGQRWFPDEWHHAVNNSGYPSLKYWLDWAPTRERHGNWTRDPPPAQEK